LRFSQVLFYLLSAVTKLRTPISGKATFCFQERLSAMKTAPAPQPVFVRQPCSENYDRMNSVHDGKFCNSCQHVVKDFTEMSNREIVEYLHSKNEKVCGRFSNEQLHMPSKKWTSALKVSVLAALALWFSKTDMKAQAKTEVAPNTTTVSDSVVLLVRGEIRSDEGKTIYRSRIEARDSSGNVIAKGYSYSGKFELHVPVAYPKQAFTIVVTAKGYRKEVIENYVSAAGNVLGIELQRMLFGKPSKGYVTVGCPSF
jgi:hypothetical protein